MRRKYCAILLASLSVCVYIAWEKRSLFQWPYTYSDCAFVRGSYRSTDVDTWQNVSSHKVAGFVFSAYFDKRGWRHGVIRVIGTSLENTPLATFCQFWYAGSKVVKTVKVWKQSLLTNYVDKRYYPVQIVCRLADDVIPEAVSVVQDRCEHPVNIMAVHDATPTENNTGFGWCVQTPIFGDYDYNRLIETFETNRLLGATKIILYNYKARAGLVDSLKWYVNEGVLELINWNIPEVALEQNLHYYGQMVSMNDCLYRMMSRVRFIAVTDIDEVLVPRKAADWSHLLRLIPQYSFWGRRHVTYYFLNSFFVIHNHTCTSTNRGASSELISIRCLFRLAPTPEGREKYIIEAKYVEYIGVHIVFKMLYHSSSVRIDPQQGLMHHYRKWDQIEGTTRDTCMLRFENTLSDRVKKVRSKMYHG